MTNIYFFAQALKIEYFVKVHVILVWNNWFIIHSKLLVLFAKPYINFSVDIQYTYVFNIIFNIVFYFSVYSFILTNTNTTAQVYYNDFIFVNKNDCLYSRFFRLLNIFHFVYFKRSYRIENYMKKIIQIKWINSLYHNIV